MKFKKCILCLIISHLLVCNIFSQNEVLPDDVEVDFWSDYPSDILARTIVERMTDQELFSQVLMFGWAGAEPSSLLYQWVNTGLGSVKVFGWNTDNIYQVAKSISSLQKKADEGRFKIPLFVATDQEGGWIRHVKGDTAITPGNMAIGASGYPMDSYYSAFYISREIKSMGINMNFAPTIDLFSNHQSSIIGTRSFGDDPDKAGLFGVYFSEGSKAAGVIPTVKHFPGHGDTDVDSHGRLPVINIDKKTFMEREIVPYKYLIESNVPALMTGHLSFPKIERSGAPASLSKYFLTDLLRGELGYKGLIITDDMMMAGATEYAGSFSNAVKLAIEAGNDIILSSTTARFSDNMWQNNIALMKSNEEFKSKVKEAACRVIEAKLVYFKNPGAAPLYPTEQDVKNSVPDKEGEKFFLEQACRSITVEKQGELPLKKDSAGKVLLAGSLQSFFKAGKERYKNAEQLYFPYDAVNISDPQTFVNKLSSMAKSYDTIIVCVSNPVHVRIAQGLKNSGKKVIIFSTMSPVLIEKLNWADTILLGYSWRCDYSMEAMIGYLNGEYTNNAIKPYK